MQNKEGNPLTIEPCSSATSTLVEGESDKLFLEDGYVRLVGSGVFEESENSEDEEWKPKKRYTYDYDLTMVKSAIVNIELAYSNTRELYVVQIKAGSESCHMTMHFLEKSDAEKIHAKIMSWFLQK